jgi:hypothetical protein
MLKTAVMASTEGIQRFLQVAGGKCSGKIWQNHGQQHHFFGGVGALPREAFFECR